MACGQITPNQFLLREYQDVAVRVRLIKQFDDDTPSCYRVEVRTPSPDNLGVPRIENQVFGTSQEQFSMALGAFKAHVLPMVDL